jgi:DNA-directed RNA polymerase subunit A'
MADKKPIFKKVKSIQFSFFSPEDVRKMAVAKVVKPELYDKEGYPVDGGLMDIRLGVIDPGLRCKTCGGKLKECVGHFGYTDLARPVIYLKGVPIIMNALNSTCRDCGKLLLVEKDKEKYMEKLKSIKDKKTVLTLIKNKAKGIKKCPYCDAKQFNFRLDKPTLFFENDKRIFPIEIRSRLEKINEEDVKFLGLEAEHCRPEWMVLTQLPVPPVTIRPSITLESGERSEDDLTHKLGDIIRINQRLFENVNAGAPEIIIEDLWDLLQYHITTLFDNTTAAVPPARHRSGEPLKTLTERIKSKEGRFRHNLTGKRVNYSARTLVSPDPQIQLGEVGVPLEVAMELTINERVTSWNIDRLKEFIKRGLKHYPGANYVIRPDGKKKKITDETVEALLDELQEGYVVERHLMDNDICIFNRQPSLHRMSIMCHKIKVLPGKSFRLNPSVCTPYNADFDGDEMNMHIPQSEEARAEAEVLMHVQNNIITPKNGLNIIAGIQDSITGNYLLTKNMEFDREEAVELLLSIGCEEIDSLPKTKKVNGKQVFSCLLPKDFDFLGYSLSHKKGDKDSVVRVQKGELISGVIDRATIGKEAGDLLRSLYIQYGPELTLGILSNISKLGIKIVTNYGFTTGLLDTDVSNEIFSEINKMMEDALKKVDVLIKEFTDGKLEAYPSKTLKATLELKILEVLNKARNKVGNLVAENSDPENPTIVMANSGARGNELNLAQIAGSVGQQALRGERINKGYKDRTLPIFKKKDLGASPHGFVKGGFKQGLKPYEFFFHAMTGRDSLMDTALRTPKSGYLYRRLANALQDLKIEYDKTVRSANNNIVQFNYGDDNVDISKSEAGTINVKKIVRETMGK